MGSHGKILKSKVLLFRQKNPNAFSAHTLAAILFLLHVPALAGTVKAIRGAYALIEDDLPIKDQDRYASRDEKGHFTGFMKVLRTNGKKAVAGIESGAPKEGEETVLIQEKAKPPEEKMEWSERSWTFGVIAAKAVAVVPVAAPDITFPSKSIELKGKTIGVFSGIRTLGATWMNIRADIGYRNIATDLTFERAVCSGTTNCTFQFGLLNLHAGLDFFPWPSWAVRPFLGIGFEIAYPVERSSSVPSTTVRRIHFFETASAGLQLRINNEHELRFSLDHTQLATTGSIKLSYTGLNLSHGWAY